jgi:uridine kinase
MSSSRQAILQALAEDLLARNVAHTLRVAIDGPDAAGKTTLADDLAAAVGSRRPVIRLSADRFHHPQAVRRRRGPLSPEGFYLDSFDHAAIIDGVLRPLGPGGDGRYQPATFDYRFEAQGAPAEVARFGGDEPQRADAAAVAPREAAAAEAVLLFDGVFLLRPELRTYWDLSIYLHVDPEVALDRAKVRDVAVFGSVDAVEQRYRLRYLPGQQLYRAQAQPAERADIVLDMNDPTTPAIVRWPARPASI